jgi:hypothetical protein
MLVYYIKVYPKKALNSAYVLILVIFFIDHTFYLCRNR